MQLHLRLTASGASAVTVLRKQRWRGSSGDTKEATLHRMLRLPTNSLKFQLKGKENWVKVRACRGFFPLSEQSVKDGIEQTCHQRHIQLWWDNLLSKVNDGLGLQSSTFSFLLFLHSLKNHCQNTIKYFPLIFPLSNSRLENTGLPKKCLVV